MRPCILIYIYLMTFNDPKESMQKKSRVML